jgi:hypothetical protein
MPHFAIQTTSGFFSILLLQDYIPQGICPSNALGLIFDKSTLLSGASGCGFAIKKGAILPPSLIFPYG